ncbi:transcriptional repressor LexA [Lichenicola cladoniae]|uniref:LexA repressor n=1 Tax=Lichenicola cladoniae TaxID=1484109 RepID=A0A6M8HVD1_9PROT|nr:transcriptional repressor LexA [Lichenicola cladoniae]NPD66515.1 transcriptional repressor LexA [Acetobacteraceae bacterium]QKE92559.1 transcriptional repressor LexA [Lichenicola cladoniae]
MLTRKQHELLGFIDRHLKETGFSPSFDEMKDALNLKSKSGIHRLISALEERGFLSRRHHRARALEVLRLPETGGRDGITVFLPEQDLTGLALDAGGAVPAPLEEQPGFAPNVIKGDFSQRLPGVRAAPGVGAVQLPLYGRIAAGLPIEALRDTGMHVEVPLALIGSGEHYALEVAGDSMIEAGILDGDTVIIRRSDSADNGQIVVALIDDAEVTLKRLRQRGNAVALEPANARYETRIIPSDRVRVQGRLVGLLRRY